MQEMIFCILQFGREKPHSLFDELCADMLQHCPSIPLAGINTMMSTHAHLISGLMSYTRCMTA
jgi:hypothetical protein